MCLHAGEIENMFVGIKAYAFLNHQRASAVGLLAITCFWGGQRAKNLFWAVRY